MRKKEQYQHLIAYFLETMPEVETELKYENPFQLLCGHNAPTVVSIS